MRVTDFLNSVKPDFSYWMGLGGWVGPDEGGAYHSADGEQRLSAGAIDDAGLMDMYDAWTPTAGDVTAFLLLPDTIQIIGQVLMEHGFIPVRPEFMQTQDTINWYNDTYETHFRTPIDYWFYLYAGGSFDSDSRIGQVFVTPGNASAYTYVNQPLEYFNSTEEFMNFIKVAGIAFGAAYAFSQFMPAIAETTAATTTAETTTATAVADAADVVVTPYVDVGAGLQYGAIDTSGNLIGELTTIGAPTLDVSININDIVQQVAEQQISPTDALTQVTDSTTPTAADVITVTPQQIADGSAAQLLQNAGIDPNLLNGIPLTDTVTAGATALSSISKTALAASTTLLPKLMSAIKSGNTSEATKLQQQLAAQRALMTQQDAAKFANLNSGFGGSKLWVLLLGAAGIAAYAAFS